MALYLLPYLAPVAPRPTRPDAATARTSGPPTPSRSLGCSLPLLHCLNPLSLLLLLLHLPQATDDSIVVPSSLSFLPFPAHTASVSHRLSLFTLILSHFPSLLLHPLSLSLLPRSRHKQFLGNRRHGSTTLPFS